MYFSTPDRLLETLRGGVAAEGHELDFKRELTTGQSANKELANDLASFAIDGGTLIIGVAEDKATGTFEPSPVPLAGLQERVEQIAQNRIRPRLHVRCRELITAPGNGFLVVAVPPSPTAPHMANDRYWGRNDTTKHILTDAEVRRILEDRAEQRERLSNLLEHEIERDPTPSNLRTNAHLFIVATPVFGHSHLLQDAVAGDSAAWTKWLRESVIGGPPYARPQIGSPDLPGLTESTARRARGWAMHTYDIGPDRRLASRRDGEDPDESDMLDLEVHEDGSLHLFCGRASDVAPSGGSPQVFEASLSCLTVRVLRTSVVVADKSSYQGPWFVGVAVTNLRGAAGYMPSQRMGRVVRYSEDAFRSSGEFDLGRLLDDEYGVADDLFGQLWRALGSPYAAASLELKR